MNMEFNDIREYINFNDTGDIPLIQSVTILNPPFEFEKNDKTFPKELIEHILKECTKQEIFKSKILRDHYVVFREILRYLGLDGDKFDI